MKITDALIYETYEHFERERVTRGRFDSAASIEKAAAKLGLTYGRVRDVVLTRMLARTGG